MAEPRPPETRLPHQSWEGLGVWGVQDRAGTRPWGAACGASRCAFQTPMLPHNPSSWLPPQSKVPFKLMGLTIAESPPAPHLLQRHHLGSLALPPASQALLSLREGTRGGVQAGAPNCPTPGLELHFLWAAESQGASDSVRRILTCLGEPRPLPSPTQTHGAI